MIPDFFLLTATIRKNDEVATSKLMDFGLYVAECMPKYVQKVQVITGDELEVLIAPEGVVPVLHFLKDHHQCQFSSLADLGAMDVPSRENRFEVKYAFHQTQRKRTNDQLSYGFS